MQSLVKIYTLASPFTGIVYYVGKTTKERLGDRLWTGHNDSISRGLRRIKSRPVIELIEECAAEDAPAIEAYWIGQMIAWGFKLENIQHNPNKRVFIIRREKLQSAA